MDSKFFFPIHNELTRNSFFFFFVIVIVEENLVMSFHDSSTHTQQKLMIKHSIQHNTILSIVNRHRFDLHELTINKYFLLFFLCQLFVINQSINHLVVHSIFFLPHIYQHRCHWYVFFSHSNIYIERHYQ